ncbi:MAG: hypothetical protein QM695_05180 [Micropruina sp.]
MFVDRVMGGDQPLPAAAGARRQARDEIDGGGGAGQDLVRERAQLEPFGHLVGGGCQLVGMNGLEHCGVGGQHTAVRAEKLVRRADEEVCPERLPVDRRMGGVVDAVHVDQCADLMRPLGDPGHRRLAAQQVGRTGDRDR